MQTYSGIKQNPERVVLMNTFSFDPEFVKLGINCPHFFINKNGFCHQFYEESVSLNAMVYNEGNIYVAFQNKSMFVDGKDGKLNILGKPYKGQFIEKKWKGYSYWDTYSENQYLMLNHLLKIFNIKNTVKSTLEYDSDIIQFKGICSRANFSPIYYDITPAFNFKNIYF